MGNGDVYGIVLQVRLAVVVVAQVHLLVEEGVQKGTHGEPLLAQGFAADEGDFLHLICRSGAELGELLLGFRNLPHADGGFVFQFLL